MERIKKEIDAIKKIKINDKWKKYQDALIKYFENAGMKNMSTKDIDKMYKEMTYIADNYNDNDTLQFRKMTLYGKG